MDGTPQYAGFGRRAATALLDAILLFAVTAPLLYLLYGTAYFTESRGAFDYAGVGDFVLNQLLPLAVAVVMWVRLRATPGKLLLDCRVVDTASLQRVTPRQAVIRYLGYFVSLLPLGLGFLWILRDRRRQGFHDLLAKTVVLYVPADEAEKPLQRLMEEMR